MSEPIIAIVHRPESFSDRWIEYCLENGIKHVMVDPFANDVIAQLKQVDGFLWHVAHFSPKEHLIAIHILYCCEKMGIASFPSLDTFWTFDDKVSQKYVLEMVGCPFVPTEIFFDETSATRWAQQTTYPKVFKLRCGAGSRNVSLVKTQAEALVRIRKAFRSGFPPTSGNISDAAGKIAAGKIGFSKILGKLQRLPKTLSAIYRINRFAPREIGYVYFQEFIPGNTHDTRVTVIGDRAVAFRRSVRPNDFRASGSGSIDYDQEPIDPECISIGFKLARDLNSQSICIDFVTGQAGKPLVVEISYVYMPQCVHAAGGHWTPDLKYVKTPIWPQEAIVDDLLAAIDKKSVSFR